MKAWKWMVWLVFAANLVACESMARVETVGVSARVINTMAGTSIVSASYNGHGIDGGGGQECCIPLPKTWQLGMTATIEWTKDPSPGMNPGGVKPPPYGRYGSITKEGEAWMKIHEANYARNKVRVSVPKYEQTCGIVLVFLPCDEVRPVIDCRENKQFFGGLASSSEVRKRIGGEKQCLQK